MTKKPTTKTKTDKMVTISSKKLLEMQKKIAEQDKLIAWQRKEVKKAVRMLLDAKREVELWTKKMEAAIEAEKTRKAK